MEGMGDDVLVHVVAQVAVEAGADVLVDRLQLDEHQRQAVDEADQVGTAVVVRGAQPGDLQLAHAQKAVVLGIAEVDDSGKALPLVALGIGVGDRHAAPDIAVERLVVLKRGAAEVLTGQFLDSLVYRLCRQLGIEPLDGCAQVAGEHHRFLIQPTQRAVRSEGLLVPGVDAVPAEYVVQVFGEGLLDQAVLAVDVGEGHPALPPCLSSL